METAAVVESDDAVDPDRSAIVTSKLFVARAAATDRDWELAVDFVFEFYPQQAFGLIDFEVRGYVANVVDSVRRRERATKGQNDESG